MNGTDLGISHFPISSLFLYNHFGKIYSISHVINKDNTFNMEAYRNYSPLYLSATYATAYLLAFALYILLPQTKPFEGIPEGAG